MCVTLSSWKSSASLQRQIQEYARLPVGVFVEAMNRYKMQFVLTIILLRHE